MGGLSCVQSADMVLLLLMRLPDVAGGPFIAAGWGSLGASCGVGMG